MKCILCDGTETAVFHREQTREYLRCPRCDLVFVPDRYHLPADREKARYDLHRQDLADSGYRAFLDRLAQPMLKKLAPGAQGLDFGCGQGPTLSTLFKESGYECVDYDLYYTDVIAIFNRQYDFITCCETMEHFCRPREELARLTHLLKPGGWLGIMTQLRDEAALPFDRWFYRDDATHICFFSRRTFQYLASDCGLRVEFHANSVVLFQSQRHG